MAAALTALAVANKGELIMNDHRDDIQRYGSLSDSRDERTVKLETDGSSNPSDSSLSDADYDARTTRLDDTITPKDEEMTRIVGGARGRRRSTVKEQNLSSPEAMDDPPAGWLVVVKGPGKGNALTLGYGTNSVGRSRDERVCLDFGDERISRKGHAVITYDSRGRKFYVQQGRGTNLVYMKDEVVLAPTLLLPFASLLIGDTTLRFVPLCGDAFDWQDYADN